MHEYKGKFVITDGLDGIGKGAVLKGIESYLKSKGFRILDLHEYWRTPKSNMNKCDHPDFENEFLDKDKKILNPFFVDIKKYDVILSSEPTYAGIGWAIRNEIIANNGRTYSARFTADAYAMDRLILYQRVIIPALYAGKIVVQSRSVSTSLVYQLVQAQVRGESLTRDEIMSLEGNIFALENAPNGFIIPTIKNVDEIKKRLDGRDKKDNCQFENIDFQLKLKPHYESSELREIFESRGTKVEYLNAGISVEATKQQAVDLFKKITGF